MSSRRRVELAITGLEVGGAERNLVELAKRLDRERWSPTVTALAPWTEGAPLVAELVAAGIPVGTLSLRGPAGLPMAMAEWTGRLRRSRPAALQTFLFHANLLGRIAGRSAGVPTIVNGWRVAERRYRWPHVVDRLTGRWADAHVAVSAGVAEAARRSAGVPRHRLHVIPNGVAIAQDLNGPPPDLSWAKRDGRASLLFVGRLDPQKGLLDLLAAVDLLSDDDRRRISVLFVGAGPQRKELEARVATAGLSEVVAFAGWQAEPRGFMRQADGLVLPSHWEGMPNAVLEAMAEGLPIVATDVEGVAELVVPGLTGWIAPRHRPDRLAAALLEFLADPDRRVRFGAAGRERAAGFGFDAMAERYMALWDSLAFPPTRPSP